MTVTRYQYMKNELDNAELKAQTLEDPIDRALFAIHADKVRARIDSMSVAEASVVMFEEDGISE